jgi:hypothetical protein
MRVHIRICKILRLLNEYLKSTRSLQENRTRFTHLVFVQTPHRITTQAFDKTFLSSYLLETEVTKCLFVSLRVLVALGLLMSQCKSYFSSCYVPCLAGS